ncbi:MAG: hypothetical protein RL090_1000 [Bacteroidota bacterium]
MAPDFTEPLKVAAKKHDLVAIRVGDQREHMLPDVGLIELTDPETGSNMLLDTSDKSVRNRYAAWNKTKETAITELFNKNGVDHVCINTGESYTGPLLNLFKRRDRKS